MDPSGRWGGGRVGGFGAEVCWRALQILTLFKTKIIVHFASLFKTRDLLSHLWLCFAPEIIKCFLIIHHGVRFFFKKYIVGTTHVDCASLTFTFFIRLLARKDSQTQNSEIIYPV